VNFCLKEIKVSRQRKVKALFRLDSVWFVSWSRLFRDKLIRQFRNVNWNEIETRFSRECSLIQKKGAFSSYLGR